MTIVLIRGRRGEDTDTQGEGHVNIEAEIGVIWPEVKECLDPPEVGRGREGSLELSEGMRLLTI